MNPKDVERKVWPLGSLYYLGSIEKAPDGPPEELPKKLITATKARLARHKSAEPPSLNELKVLALDLIGYYSEQRLPLPKDTTMLIGLLMGMSEAQLQNPHEFLEAGRAVGRPSNSNKARDIAFFIDVAYWRKHGKMMSIRQLSKLVAERLEVPAEESASRDSLTQWREEYVNIFDMRGVQKLD